MTHFKHNIKIYKELYGLTQAEMAVKMGVSLAVWKNFEDSRTKPALIYLEKLAQITGIDQEDLFNRNLKEGDFPRPVDYKAEYEKALDKILKLKEKLAFAPETEIKDTDIKQQVGIVRGVGAIKEISDVEKVVINPAASEAADKTGIAEIQKNLVEILAQVIGIQKKLEAIELYPMKKRVISTQKAPYYKAWPGRHTRSAHR